MSILDDLPPIPRVPANLEDPEVAVTFLDQLRQANDAMDRAIERAAALYLEGDRSTLACAASILWDRRHVLKLPRA